MRGQQRPARSLTQQRRPHFRQGIQPVSIQNQDPLIFPEQVPYCFFCFLRQPGPHPEGRRAGSLQRFPEFFLPEQEAALPVAQGKQRALQDQRHNGDGKALRHAQPDHARPGPHRAGGEIGQPDGAGITHGPADQRDVAEKPLVRVFRPGREKRRSVPVFKILLHKNSSCFRRIISSVRVR